MTDLPILCLVRDLLFYSKIRAAAESAGVVLKSVRDPGKLVDEAGAGLIVDLNQPQVLEAAGEWRGSHGGEPLWDLFPMWIPKRSMQRGLWGSIGF